MEHKDSIEITIPEDLKRHDSINSIGSPISFGRRTPATPEDSVKKDMKLNLNLLTTANFDKILDKLLNLTLISTTHEEAEKLIKHLGYLVVDTAINQLQKHVNNNDDDTIKQFSKNKLTESDKIKKYSDALLKEKNDINNNKLYAKLCIEFWTHFDGNKNNANITFEANIKKDRCIRDVGNGSNIFIKALRERCEIEFNINRIDILSQIYENPDSEENEFKFRKKTFEFMTFISNVYILTKKILNQKFIISCFEKLFNINDETYNIFEIENGLILFLYIGGSIKSHEIFEKIIYKISLINKNEDMKIKYKTTALLFLNENNQL